MASGAMPPGPQRSAGSHGRASESVADLDPAAVFESFAQLVRTGDARQAPSASVGDARQSSLLTFIRDVVDRLRGLRERAEREMRDAQKIAREAVLAMRAAEQRARLAEDAAQEALVRAERAEQQLYELRRQPAPDSDDKEQRGDVDLWVKQAHLQLRQVRKGGVNEPRS